MLIKITNLNITRTITSYCERGVRKKYALVHIEEFKKIGNRIAKPLLGKYTSIKDI